MKAFLVMALLTFPVITSAQSVKVGAAPGVKYDQHLVMKGETVYSVARLFSTTPAEIVAMNPALSDRGLKEGEVIKVPISKWKGENGTMGMEKKATPVLHTVTAGETAYSISKKYQTDVATLLQWNHRTAATVKTGESLIVGYEQGISPLAGLRPAEAGEADAEAATMTMEPEENSGDEIFTSPFDDKEEAAVAQFERGIATWTQSSYDDGNFYALHGWAPKGTEMTVKNQMNNRSVRVTVMGRLPAAAGNEKVIIKISESAAKQLNVLDEKFLAELEFVAAPRNRFSPMDAAELK
jgi:LysM repeat protein